MRWISKRFLLLLMLFTAGAARAESDLTGVYAAILKGNYDTGRAELERLRTQGASQQEVARLEGWLDAYRQAVASRAEMKAQTFAWNVENARKALAEGELYLALNFAAQARAYAPDEDAFARAEWVQELTKQARAASQTLAAEQSWPRAMAYYRRLALIHPDDTALKELGDDAARHARLEMIYTDKEALERRIRDVDRNLLRNALMAVDKSYFEQPDFRRMAEGALNNLISVAQTKKLQEFLDGLANPDARGQFVTKLQELLRSVQQEEHYGYKDARKLFNSVLDANRLSVELPEGLLVVEFMEGALQQLDDFSSMIWPADAPDFDKMMLGGFEGVGIQLGVDERTNRLMVVTPLEDSPALEAGIQPGDLIVEVDGQTTEGWDTDDAVRNIMGKGGTRVVLTIFRPGTGARIPFELVRRKIVLRTVRGLTRQADDPQNWNYMLDPDASIAYIRLTGFHPDSHEELVKALQGAQQQGMRGLILDVRHNPGGLLDVAVRIVSTFLREGEVVSTGGRVEPQTRLDARPEGLVSDVPLVVLVNEGSASASEILAGALHDHNRAIVLGERTFGKGSVQKVMNVTREARLKLTTALYYLPSGRSPHKSPGSTLWGVDPDWEVRLTPKELRQVVKRENEAQIIHNEKETAASAPSNAGLDALKATESDADKPEPLLTDEQIKALEADPVKTLETDPQLETALLLLRVKLAANLPWPEQLAVKADQLARPGN